ncbi:MAG: hypothetical protein M5U28_47960 [Sandaracinaceae bacterium]|nr:hypothetical protein [Sandaracinaceae bacterium]
MRWLYALLMRAATLAWLVLLAGCTGGSTLTIDLKTDYVAGREFVLVRTQRISAPGGAPIETEASVGERFLDGRRVAELGGLPEGTHTVQVELLDAAGAVVAGRTVNVLVRGPTAATVLITRDCALVACPGAEDPPDAITCVGGRCAVPECTPENPEACPEPECTSDAQCDEGSGCVVGLCADGVCLRAAQDSRCAGGEWCHPDEGCTPLEPERDAGPPPPDAGTQRDAGCVGSASEVRCDDRADDDCDGRVDCADSDCDGMACGGGAVCAAGTCGGCVASGPIDGCGGGDQDCDGTVDEDCGCRPGQWIEGTIDTFGDVGREAAVALDAEGGVHVSYRDASNNDLRYAYHAPSGFWASELVEDAGNVGTDTDVAAHGAELHVLHYDATNRDLRYAVRRADGTWERAVVDSSGTVGQTPSLAIDALGGAHAAYYDATNGDLRYAYRPPGGLWMPETVASAGNVGLDGSIGVDESGQVHIAFRNATANDLMYATGTPGSFTVTTVDSAGDVGRDAALAVGADGVVHVVYRDASATALDYARLAPGGSWSFEVADDDANMGQYASIAVDEEGEVHAAHFDATSNDLRYAQRAADGTWTRETVESQGTIGTHTAIAVHAGGVHIAYHDASNRDLRYARRDAGGAWRAEPVETVGYRGEHAAMAIDDRGVVYVTHRDEDADDLRLAARPRRHVGADHGRHPEQPGGSHGHRRGRERDGAHRLPRRDRQRSALRAARGRRGLHRRDRRVGGQRGERARHRRRGRRHGADRPLRRGARRPPARLAGPRGHVERARAGDGGLRGAGRRRGRRPLRGLHIVFFDESSDDLRYLLRPSGGAFGAAGAVLTAGRVGRSSGLVIDDAGGAHAVAWDETAMSLAYAYHAAGGLWTFETADSGGDVGEHADVAVDASGAVHAVSFDATVEDAGTIITYRYDLRYARRAPGGGWTASTIDAQGDVGRYAAIAVTPDGMVHVVYFENGADDLRHLRYCP